ncbi:type 2 periplasmic-binding domain-containing protein [Dongshaea marina]|uniref:hypothetical protein n=1 Tax=Dongshaea marina TaxID=2047966 RepID=UPI000D3EC950|nr:hypothetical protein [Dongshaea marina]
MKKRISGYIEELISFNFERRSDLRLKEFKAHPFYINQDSVYFGASKKAVDDALLKKLQAAFTLLKQRGELQRIAKKYQ